MAWVDDLGEFTKLKIAAKPFILIEFLAGDDGVTIDSRSLF